MELRPFRALRYSPGAIARCGLAALIRTREDGEASAAAENVSALLFPTGTSATLHAWIEAGTLVKERRPALWAYRQTREENGKPVVLDLLVGIVRLSDSVAPAAESGGTAPEERSRRVGWLAEMKADFEPSLLRTRAPVAAALSSGRPPEFSALDAGGVRHDARRIIDFAEHVELQGLVKHSEAAVAADVEAFEAARQFANGPAAARLPGARYKLCAILDESLLRDAPLPAIPRGLFGFSLEDAVY